MVNKFILAIRAKIDWASRARTFPLKYRLVSRLVALSAKPMRWLGYGGAWFYLIDKNTGSNFLKLIAHCLGFPSLKLGNLLFKCLFLLQQSVLIRMQRRHLILHGQDSGVQLDGLLDDLSRCFHVACELGDFCQRFK